MVNSTTPASKLAENSDRPGNNKECVTIESPIVKLVVGDWLRLVEPSIISRTKSFKRITCSVETIIDLCITQISKSALYQLVTQEI